MIILNDKNRFSYYMIGEFHSDGVWIHPRRSINSYELILVLDGTLYIGEDGTEYTLTHDDMIILEPEREHYGYRETSEHTAFYWFHFCTDMPLPFKVCTDKDVYEVKQLLKKLLHITNTPSYSISSHDALSYIIYEELLQFKGSNSCEHLLIGRINEYIRNHITEHITVADIADSLGYNADYIGKLFKKSYGKGLKEYISEQRLKKAKDMLLTTNMSIKEISSSLGYNEENLFIKFFIYHENASPSAFRKKYYGTHINHK